MSETVLIERLQRAGAETLARSRKDRPGKPMIAFEAVLCDAGIVIEGRANLSGKPYVASFIASYRDIAEAAVDPLQYGIERVERQLDRIVEGKTDG